MSSSYILQELRRRVVRQGRHRCGYCRRNGNDDRPPDPRVPRRPDRQLKASIVRIDGVSAPQTKLFRLSGRTSPSLPPWGMYQGCRPSSGPQDLDVVGRELTIRGQQRQLLDLSLGHQQPVERIAMMMRKPGHSKRMDVVDRQLRHALLSETARHEPLGRLGQLQFPELPTELHRLPRRVGGGARAGPRVVRRAANALPGAGGVDLAAHLRPAEPGRPALVVPPPAADRVVGSTTALPSRIR